MATIGTNYFRGVASNQGIYNLYVLRTSMDRVGTTVSGHYREGGH